jgi:predicted nucleic-acid-binding protein
VKAVDTNVLARLLLADDRAQHEAAKAIVSDPIWIAPTVWLELGWVLGRKLKLDRTLVADLLLALLSTKTVNTGNEDGLRWAIARFKEGADWADAMHLIMAGGVASAFVTFDRGITRAIGEDTPLAIETVA